MRSRAWRNCWAISVLLAACGRPDPPPPAAATSRSAPTPPSLEERRAALEDRLRSAPEAYASHYEAWTAFHREVRGTAFEPGAAERLETIESSAALAWRRLSRDAIAMAARLRSEGNSAEARAILDRLRVPIELDVGGRASAELNRERARCDRFAGLETARTRDLRADPDLVYRPWPEDPDVQVRATAGSEALALRRHQRAERGRRRISAFDGRGRGLRGASGGSPPGRDRVDAGRRGSGPDGLPEGGRGVPDRGGSRPRAPGARRGDGVAPESSAFSLSPGGMA